MSPLFFVLLLGLLSTSLPAVVAGFSPTNYNVVCQIYGYWMFVPLSRSLVQSWLPAGVEFGQHPFNLSSSVWPVLLEFNAPTDCYSTSLPFIKTTMLEWKLEVPYLSQPGFKGPLMYKPVIYQNNAINRLASILIYGLNAVEPQQMMENNQTNPGQYAVSAERNVGVMGAFYPVDGQEEMVPVSEADYVQEYVRLNDATEWLGHDIFQRERCAKIYYVWSNSFVRPVTAHVHFDSNFLTNWDQAVDYSSEGGFIQAVQIQTIEHTTPLDKCTSD